MGSEQANGLERALARAGDGAFAVTPDSRVVFWNRSAEKILGYTSREMLGRLCCDTLAGRDDRGNRLCYRGCHVMTLVKMGDPIQNFDMQTRTKSGRPVWLNVSTLVATDGPSGQLTVHLFRDITATKELLSLVQERNSPPVAPAEDTNLTRRELEILKLLAAGESTRAAAERLNVSPATVRNHVQSILGKLGVHSRLQAVAYANTRRIL